MEKSLHRFLKLPKLSDVKKGELYDKQEQGIKEGAIGGGLGSLMSIFDMFWGDEDAETKTYIWLKYSVTQKVTLWTMQPQSSPLIHIRLASMEIIKCGLNEGMQIYHGPKEKHSLVTEFKVNFPENALRFPDEISLPEKLPERKEVDETDEMDQVELVVFVSNQERWHHYNGEAYEDNGLQPRAVVQCHAS
ncbi:DnaJ-like protein subfamily A member 1 [Heterocephalus glaber]|uniref:DnaJ-like protein subfamily A member 1 n=1 Tax=Heterocephalus glaber TaxID=10181 RepID=G5C4Q2_HETGA|nr:DnaJ-like protein subfamily A member 1 [Heterocephalus glaber]